MHSLIQWSVCQLKDWRSGKTIKAPSQLAALLTAGQSVCLDIQESTHAHRHTKMYACIPTITEAHTERQRAAEKEADEDEEEDWGEMQTQC